MNDERVVVGVVAVILLTTLASGPLVGAIDLTTESTESGFGHGNVTVDSATLPENATLQKARFGAGGYTLRVPAATIELGEVTGQPRLNYEIAIPDLNYSRSSVHTPTGVQIGEYSLSLEDAALDEQQIEARQLNGTVSVTLMANHSEREIASRDVVVEVVE